MGLVSGNDAFVARALQVAGGWASNLLKMTLLPREAVMTLDNAVPGLVERRTEGTSGLSIVSLWFQVPYGNTCSSFILC